LSPQNFMTAAVEMLEMIRTKAEGVEYEAEEVKIQPSNMIDIVARLKASLEQAEEQKKAGISG